MRLCGQARHFNQSAVEGEELAFAPRTANQAGELLFEVLTVRETNRAQERAAGIFDELHVHQVAIVLAADATQPGGFPVFARIVHACKQIPSFPETAFAARDAHVILVVVRLGSVVVTVAHDALLCPSGLMVWQYCPCCDDRLPNSIGHFGQIVNLYDLIYSSCVYKKLYLSTYFGDLASFIKIVD